MFCPLPCCPATVHAPVLGRCSAQYSCSSSATRNESEGSVISVLPHTAHEWNASSFSGSSTGITFRCAPCEIVSRAVLADARMLFATMGPKKSRKLARLAQMASFVFESDAKKCSKIMNPEKMASHFILKGIMKKRSIS